MAVPRRFDRRPPERDKTRTNEQIRVAEVRLIADDGAQVGIVKIDDALAFARDRDLDLVEVSPESKPPVCRVLDYSKYKYEQTLKAKATRKHQQQITVREIKLRPKIATHDYETKRNHVERFLRHSDKVKVTIMFRGREMAHPERGTMLLQRLAEDVAELGNVEQAPLRDGRNMTMVLGPVRSKVEMAADEAAKAAANAAKANKQAEKSAPADAAPADTTSDEVTAAVEAPVEETSAEVTPAVEPPVADAAEDAKPVAAQPAASN